MRNKKFKRWAYFRDAGAWYLILRLDNNEISLCQVDSYGAHVTNTKKAMKAEDFLYMILGNDVVLQSRPTNKNTI